MSEDLKVLIEETKSLVVKSQKERDEELKQYKEETGEIKSKFDKQSEEIIKAMEKIQLIEAKQKALECLSNGQSNNEAETKSKEISKHFEDFIRKGAFHNHHDFKDYCVQKGIEIKAMSVNSDTDGGYLVIPQYDTLRKTREFETSPMRQYASVMTISSDRLLIPVDQDEATSGGWIGETATRSNTNTPTIKQIEIPVHEQYAQPVATLKLLDDAGVNIESWLAGKVTDIISRTENTAFISGNGVAKPRGILNYSAWSVNGTYEYGKIEQVNSGAAADFTADGLIDLQNSLKEFYQNRAVFMIKRNAFKNIMKLKDGMGQYLFNRNMDKSIGKPFDLLGNPVVFADDMPVVASNALALAYGDFNAGYQIVDRIGIRVLRDPFTSKGNILFYTTKRVGGAVVNFEAIKLQKLAA